MAFKYKRIQLEVTTWWIICILKNKNKNSQLCIAAKVSSLFTVLCYMELFGRSRSNSLVYTVIKMRQTLMDSKKGRTP